MSQLSDLPRALFSSWHRFEGTVTDWKSHLIQFWVKPSSSLALSLDFWQNKLAIIHQSLFTSFKEKASKFKAKARSSRASNWAMVQVLSTSRTLVCSIITFQSSKNIFTSQSQTPLLLIWCWVLCILILSAICRASTRPLVMSCL